MKVRRHEDNRTYNIKTCVIGKHIEEGYNVLVSREVHVDDVPRHSAVRRMLRPMRSAIFLQNDFDRDLLVVRASACLQNEAIPTAAKEGTQFVLGDEVGMNVVAFGEVGAQCGRWNQQSTVGIEELRTLSVSHERWVRNTYHDRTYWS